MATAKTSAPKSDKKGLPIGGPFLLAAQEGQRTPSNPTRMRKALLIVLCALGLTCFAPGASATDLEVGGRVMAGGGTLLTNGVFFPGTALPNNDGTLTEVLPPVEMQRGTDLEFVNLDESTVSNGHKLVSLKRRRGYPLFASDMLTRPGQTDIVFTSNLKPGIYPFYCSTHAGMWGQIEIVR